MNQNRTVFDIDEETDAFYLQKAVEYHEWLIQQEAQPRLTRTPIFRDREDAERRLRADYFDDHLLIVCTGNAPKHTYFKQRQESARKDVERAFGVLQGRWGLIQQPARAYEVNTLRRIMYAGIIMHNMILEDQNMSVVDWKHVYSNPARSLQTVWIDRCQTQRRKAKELRDKDTHISLQQNLMNHIWREVEEASEED
ncbi:putative nuclease HARBI1 isoform X2 [Tanacetum coccineum]